MLSPLAGVPRVLYLDNVLGTRATRAITPFYFSPIANAHVPRVQ